MTTSRPDPWTLYWQSGHARSCIATQSSDDTAVVSAFWQSFADSLADDSTVLDLATGNGTVPAMLKSAKPALVLTGVDRAAIDPHEHLKDHSELSDVTFQGAVDVTALPFADGSFDAVTSQYGIEYAPLDKAIPEAARVLKVGGRMGLLLHHTASGVVGPAADRCQEMNALLTEEGVVPKLLAVAAGQLAPAELEQAGQAHLSSSIERTAQVTGQVFAGVNQVMEHLRNQQGQAARELAAVLHLRLTADRDRLAMLEAAALDHAAVDALVDQLSSSGVRCERLEALTASDEDALIVGWAYLGTRVD